MRTLWIPPSAGWLLLGRRAQQLVGDVLILLTLAERGDTEEDWAWNFGKINCASLPHCLTQERGEHLRPTDTAGVTQRSPGDTCKGGCPVHLCPYPPKGQQPYRVELSEAFCRQQREAPRPEAVAVRRASPVAGTAIRALVVLEEDGGARPHLTRATSRSMAVRVHGARRDEAGFFPVCCCEPYGGASDGTGWRAWAAVAASIR